MRDLTGTTLEYEGYELESTEGEYEHEGYELDAGEVLSYALSSELEAPAACHLAVPEVLDRFAFDRDAVLPHHQQRIAQIARCVVGSSPRPVRFIRVVGHADPVGSHAYNMALGRRRAENVRIAMARAIDRIQPGLSRNIRFRVESHGDWEQISSVAARDRRVEIFVAMPSYARPQCGGRAAPYLHGDTQDEVHRQAPRKTPVVATNRLVFYQDDPENDGSHFRNCATAEASRIRALAQPSTNPGRRVGPTPFTSGQDILEEIAAAAAIVGPITRIHIFGHAGPRGIGGVGSGACGLYMPGTITPTRPCGGRLLTALTAATLTSDVTFVLHGCRLAGNIHFLHGTDFNCTNARPTDTNFARSLFQHLRTTLNLRSPQVFGHCASGCAGRDQEWREYSNAHPTGLVRSTLGALYHDVCCNV